jgi:hypothetical protein
VKWFAPRTVRNFHTFTNNVQFDIRAGVGLNRHAADCFAGSGCSIRYGDGLARRAGFIASRVQQNS